MYKMLLSFIILTITFAPVQSVWSLSLDYLPLSRRRVLYRSRSCPPFESQAAEFARSILRAWNCRHIVNFTRRRRRILRVRAIGRNCSLLDENKIASEAADSSLSLSLSFDDRRRKEEPSLPDPAFARDPFLPSASSGRRCSLSQRQDK